jgi:hypothetical protein
MPFKVRQAICTDTGERVKVKRKIDGYYDNGIWNEGHFILLKALASVQQPTKQQLELFTGLERDKDMKTFYVNIPIVASSEFDDTQADEILWKDRVYRAMKIGEWESYGYNIVMGVRIK